MSENAAPSTLVGAALFFSCLGGSVATVVAEREQQTLKRLFISSLSGTEPQRRSGKSERRIRPSGGFLRSELCKREVSSDQNASSREDAEGDRTLA